MNDGKIIIDKIIEKAEAEAKAIKDKANLDVEAILKAAEEKAKRDSETLKKNAESEAEKVKAKAISGAQLQGKIAVLQEKQGILDDVIAQAKKRLETLPDVQYAVTVGAMLAKLDKKDGTEIIVSENDRERLAAVVAQNGFTLSNQSRELDGGFVVKNGDIEYNYSFESIIAVEQEEIRQIAAKILF
ncbi:V-type ATP synthase subunit E [Anaerotignum sp. MB30-C6]|uniref:V-type ATP synthase subunit E n=1 Tax=Anaerotignum sp. MB30-C6 TaxID=3070814 RepID=UPI0027DD042C|nr:V-type ATP synthase subunit E [Anaerotignum sp. MB30-C6]WMI80310.1 V-type ATP synthase subunit E [Anaerotignum sp. MB30-C6]